MSERVLSTPDRLDALLTQADSSAELDAMRRVVEALEAVDMDTRQRVLVWAKARTVTGVIETDQAMESLGVVGALAWKLGGLMKSCQALRLEVHQANRAPSPAESKIFDAMQAGWNDPTP